MCFSGNREYLQKMTQSLKIFVNLDNRSLMYNCKYTKVVDTKKERI